MSVDLNVPQEGIVSLVVACLFVAKPKRLLLYAPYFTN